MTGTSTKRDDKTERLAEALRANLAKRKAQARGRREPCTPEDADGQ